MGVLSYQWFFEYTTKSVQIIFAYFVPLLSSIRAVRHGDKESYRQWVTYFLLLQIIHPIISMVRFNPLLEFIFVLWLSLPRFQGALRLYSLFQKLILDKYGVEEIVDGHINFAKREIRLIILRSLSEAGWALLYQIGTFVSMVKGTKQDKVKMNDGIFLDNHSISRSGVVSDKELNSNENSKRLLNPQHSVTESISMSSLPSMDSEGETTQDDYITDFLNMISRGLYVFSKSTISSEANRSNNRINKKNNFRLRVFSYERDEKSLLLSSVGSTSLTLNENHDDVFWIPISMIYCVNRSDNNGITFISRYNDDIDECDDSLNHILAEITLADEEDRDTLLKGLSVCISALNNNRNSLNRSKFERDNHDNGVGGGLEKEGLSGSTLDEYSSLNEKSRNDSNSDYVEIFSKNEIVDDILSINSNSDRNMSHPYSETKSKIDICDNFSKSEELNDILEHEGINVDNFSIKNLSQNNNIGMEKNISERDTTTLSVPFDSNSDLAISFKCKIEQNEFVEELKNIGSQDLHDYKYVKKSNDEDLSINDNMSVNSNSDSDISFSSRFTSEISVSVKSTS